MIAYFILGLALLVGLVLLARWFAYADTKQLVPKLRWVLIGLGVIVGLVVLVLFRQYIVALLLPFLILYLKQRGYLRQRWKASRGPTPSQQSDIVTRYLKMTLDHDSGAMAGQVLKGAYAGRALSALSMEELISLWHECVAADQESAAVLEAYLDREKGEAWREAAGASESTSEAPAGGRIEMTPDEAYAVLGLEPGASADEISEAHKRLMQKIHPDKGGSNYLAAKINEAKRVLLVK